MDLHCENCKFWEQEESDIPSMGLCHRYAPRPVATHPVKGPESMDTVWPRTKGEEWCGEWKAKVEVNDE
jgi:hypothetical protein